MGMTRIGAWEFNQGPQRLTYRLTVKGLVPGVIICLALAGVFALWSYKIFTQSSPWYLIWGTVTAVVSLACCYGLFHHLRSRSHPYALDKHGDYFLNGKRKIFAVSEIRSISVTKNVSTSGTADIDEASHTTSYDIDFVLHNGDIYTTYLSARSMNQANQLKQMLDQFIGLRI